MERAALVPLALVFLAICAASQGPTRRAKPAPQEPEQPPAEPFAPPEQQDAKDTASKQGFAPDQVQLGDPIQPTEIQIRQGPAITADPRAKLRTVVRILVNYERGHRDRVARLERLRGIFAAAGAAEKVSEVKRLRDVEDARFAAAQRGYERDLGPSIYAQVRAVLDSNGGPPPSAAALPAEPAKGAKAARKPR